MVEGIIALEHADPLQRWQAKVERVRFFSPAVLSRNLIFHSGHLLHTLRRALTSSTMTTLKLSEVDYAKQDKRHPIVLVQQPLRQLRGTRLSKPFSSTSRPAP